MGGVTSMNGFLDKYFPSVAAKQSSTNTPGNLYCQYDSQTLQLMTSVLFIAGAITEITGTTGTLPTQSNTWLIVSICSTKSSCYSFQSQCGLCTLLLVLPTFRATMRVVVWISECVSTCCMLFAAALSRYQGRKRVMM